MSLADAVEQVRATVAEPRLHRLLDQWHAKAPADGLPARPDFDPQELTYILGNLLLVDVERVPLRFRYRLVGTNLTGYFGFDPTGQAVDEHPDPTFRKAALATYGKVTATGLPLAYSRDTVMDGRLRQYQVMFLPLAGDGRTVDIILCAYGFEPER